MYVGTGKKEMSTQCDKVTNFNFENLNSQKATIEWVSIYVHNSNKNTMTFLKI